MKHQSHVSNCMSVCWRSAAASAGCAFTRQWLRKLLSVRGDLRQNPLRWQRQARIGRLQGLKQKGSDTFLETMSTYPEQLCHGLLWWHIMILNAEGEITHQRCFKPDCMMCSTGKA